MGGNTFGEMFKIMTFGESHGKAIGVVIDGCPAGLMMTWIKSNMIWTGEDPDNLRL